MIDELTNELTKLNIVEQFIFLSKKYRNKICFSTSFQFEDQIITDIIFSNNIDIEVFTLDTGRHFEETYKTLNQTIKKYNKKINVLFPENSDIEELMTQKGAYSFYESLENRKECCYLRKVKPLNKYLEGKSCWITGLRAEQNVSRTNLNILENDESHNLLKFNPLLHWTSAQIKDYIFKNNVPYNVLQDKNYPSIGCAPCTRAIKEGEDIRAGRWWWETPDKKECGLHVK